MSLEVIVTDATSWFLDFLKILENFDFPVLCTAIPMTLNSNKILKIRTLYQNFLNAGNFLKSGISKS